jgi:hypothetical protein
MELRIREDGTGMTATRKIAVAGYERVLEDGEGVFSPESAAEYGEHAEKC